MSPPFLRMEGTDMDMIEMLKAILEIAGGLALIGACIAISVNVEIVIHFGKPRKTRKKSKNNRPQFPNLGGYFLII